MNTAVFKNEVEFASSAVERKSTIPILMNLLVEQRDGAMTITGTDLEVVAVTAFQGDKNPIRTTLPSRRLKQTIAAFNGSPDCQIVSDKTFEATLSAGTFSARIPGMSADSFPTAPNMPADMTPLALKPLLSAIAVTSHAISMEESRFTLNGSLLMIDAKGNVLGVDANHAFFLTHFKERSFRLLMGRKLTGNFPDYERVIPKDSPIKATVGRAELLAACNKILPFADENSRAGRLIFKGAGRGGTVTVYASVSELGDARDVVKYCDLKVGTDLEIGMNLWYVIQALDSMTSQEIEVGLKDAISPMSVKGTADNGVSVHNILMPMRI